MSASESLKARAHLRDTDVDRRIIENDLKEIRFDDVEWINLDHDGDQWRAVVNTLIKIRVS